MYQHLLVSKPHDKIFQITLNRPRQLNALAKITFQELGEAISEFVKSQEHVLILTGAGRAFCFGADFTEFEDQSQLPVLLQIFQDLILKLYRCPKLTVAALNGFATGAGLDLALACDFRISAEKAKLAEAYISMGLVSDGGGSFLLSHMIGMPRALELLATGESLTAEQALQLGIVNKICPAEELNAKSIEYAAKLAEKPQTAVRLLKKLVKQNSGATLKTALENEREAQLICFEDETHQRIVQEFLTKRKSKTAD
ncbi:MAG: hypothetical protein C5B54_00560 [Acidobacteria bacterium]|nr:MAG: hypothetical protein C5B54_00560 [Acidobacteriota bacterium]